MATPHLLARMIDSHVEFRIAKQSIILTGIEANAFL